MDRDYSKKKAFLIIGIITLLVSGGATAFLFFSDLYSQFHSHDSRYHITALVQKSSSKESLKTLFFAEKLGLSKDHPTNLYDFDIQKGKQALEQTYVIDAVTLKKICPDRLFIDYTLRAPFLIFMDLSNTYIDRKGFLFPASPFFSPKKIPELVIGSGNYRWGSKIDEDQLEIVHSLLSQLKGVLRIDLSRYDAPKLGSREIVVMVKERKSLHTLRLPVEGFDIALQNYFSLNENLLKKESGDKIIDLRLGEIAFLRDGRP